MNESYRLGEQSIIAYLQRLANGVSTAELDVAATVTSSNSGAKATPSPAPILTSTISSIAMIGLATPKAIAIF